MCTMNTLDSSRIRTRIVRVKGEHTDHLTTMARVRLLLLFKNRANPALFLFYFRLFHMTQININR